MKFGITFDYLCPFARNASEAVLKGVEQGKEWDARFVAFSLAQVHIGEGDQDVWDEPEGKSGVLALQWGVAARDNFPDDFPAVHRALFAARHDHGNDIKDESVVRQAVAATGADVDAIAEVVESGLPLKTIAAEHTECVEKWQVFGVPTFLADDDATFIRFMSRGDVDHLELALDLLAFTDLNEFKRTTIPK